MNTLSFRLTPTPSVSSFSYKLYIAMLIQTISNARNEYAEGFSTGNIEDSSPSINTYVPYARTSIFLKRECA